MSHRVIIIDSNPQKTSSDSSLAQTDVSSTSVHIEYRPAHSLTPADVGREITRLLKLVDKVEVDRTE